MPRRAGRRIRTATPKKHFGPERGAGLVQNQPYRPVKGRRMRLPKTRSGKIMRRLLKEIAAGKTVTGDTTTLEDLSVIAKLSAAQD